MKIWKDINVVIGITIQTILSLFLTVKNDF